MKKTLFVLPLVAAAMCGCSQADENFSSPDLTMAQAHGHVKSITTEEIFGKLEGDSVVVDTSFGEESGRNLVVREFDEQGRLTAYKEGYWAYGKNNYFLEYDVDYTANEAGEASNANKEEFYRDLKVTLGRDDNGYVNAFTFGKGQDFDGQRDTRYTWTDGRLTGEANTGWEDAYESTYTYDEAGNLLKETISSNSVEGSSMMEITYKIQATDEHGNWTRRARIHQLTHTEDEFEGPSDGPFEPYYIIESRKIEYYPAK